MTSRSSVVCPAMVEGFDGQCVEIRFALCGKAEGILKRG